MATERRIVHFHGRVQGVGFRARTRALASGFAVSGTVRNLRDGSVEVIAEGEAQELARFLDAIHRELSREIESSSSGLLAEGEPIAPGFSIVY